MAVLLAVGVAFSSSLSAAPDYIVERIEKESSSRGYYPQSIYRDSSCMCGKDLVADYIFEFYVPNSFKNLKNLRITTTNLPAACYLVRGYVDARVYPNDTIRACVGFNLVLGCGIVPYRGDVAIWIKK
ncbi:MAG: hypothetical protein V1688_04105 [bacterium]